ncbi:2-dehydropantoate 2-reductase [Paraburkholderia sp. D15]|uniref:2-dehydropantoate 2-reductase n=1 Tax=Paraburkholderia sp. D15 TaxID=2880218 RepID=UPI0024790A8A|nr:2-dehydropantoate 2-reductase [Paraburkholderia sp. D15]WGS52275.1 2-dehydropantoate 2-reductase [Paraburkholderia sp. D15]
MNDERDRLAAPRILIVGAGAVGGYVGARLLAACQDVTFLVRPKRAAQLARDGLRVESALGDCAIAPVRCVSASTIDGFYDLVIVACKARQLDDALASFAPALGPHTVVLPLLNGIAHLDDIARACGAHRVLGAQCTLAAALSPEGCVRHLNDSHALTLGELDGTLSPRVEALASLFGAAGFQRAASTQIQLEMWEKWAFIVTAIGVTVIARVAPDAVRETARPGAAGALLSECRAVAQAAGFALRSAAVARARMILDAPDSTLTDLIFADLQQWPATETDLLLGDLVRRAHRAGVSVPRLSLAHITLTQHRPTFL